MEYSYSIFKYPLYLLYLYSTNESKANAQLHNIESKNLWTETRHYYISSLQWSSLVLGPEGVKLSSLWGNCMKLK